MRFLHLYENLLISSTKLKIYFELSGENLKVYFEILYQNLKIYF